ncbi:hypothetical protein KFK09_020123 [Dendrobium nobile]|uniref:Uncharacterized protein n=1 Tax=Dendrobium nobile TaxID=94219 RepID=A0A8T3ASX8_DENNO|nr:hypothetical protein KFK09_020123 [Dendrobium nobile]
MVCSHLHKLLLLLFFVCLLAFQSEKANSIRSIEHGFLAEAPSNFKEVEVVNVDSRKGSEISPSSFDLNRTSKRRVRRGSDPIHNRC